MIATRIWSHLFGFPALKGISREVSPVFIICVPVLMSACIAGPADTCKFISAQIHHPYNTDRKGLWAKVLCARSQQRGLLSRVSVWCLPKPTSPAAVVEAEWSAGGTRILWELPYQVHVWPVSNTISAARTGLTWPSDQEKKAFATPLGSSLLAKPSMSSDRIHKETEEEEDPEIIMETVYWRAADGFSWEQLEIYHPKADGFPWEQLEISHGRRVSMRQLEISSKGRRVSMGTIRDIPWQTGFNETTRDIIQWQTGFHGNN